ISHNALATGLRRVMHMAAATTASPANAQKMISVGFWPIQISTSLALRVGRIPQRRDRVGLRAQPLQIVHEAIARELGVLVMHPDVNRLLGADLLAIAAEDAAELVAFVDQRIAVALLVLAGHQLDA